MTSRADADITVAVPARPALAAHQESARWIYGFIGFQIACQLALLFPAIAPLRVFVRVAAFAASFYCLVRISGRGRRHPSARAAQWAMGILALSIFHPTSNTVASAVAQAGLYGAILAPLFWVPRLRVDAKALRWTMVILWVFNTASAGVGVLQVFYPGRFQPAMSTVIAS